MFIPEPEPGSGTKIRILIFYPSRIPDPGVKKAPDPGSDSATLLLKSTPFHNKTCTENYQGLLRIFCEKLRF